MDISKNDVMQYRAISQIHNSMKDNALAMCRIGILDRSKIDLIQIVNAYLKGIADPVKRYALRVSFLFDCEPSTAAYVAVKHFKKAEPDRETTRAITEFINAELKSMK